MGIHFNFKNDRYESAAAQLNVCANHLKTVSYILITTKDTNENFAHVEIRKRGRNYFIGVLSILDYKPSPERIWELSPLCVSFRVRADNFCKAAYKAILEIDNGEHEFKTELEAERMKMIMFKIICDFVSD